MKRFRERMIANALARRNGVPPLFLYVFTTATFTSAGVIGQTGPTLAQCRTAYSTAGYTWASTFLDMTTQGYQLWTVPKTGDYVVRCAGASIYTLSGGGYGKGIIIETTLSLTKGDQIQLLVGQRGTPVNAGASETNGAGGGSFVASGTTPAAGVCLVAAGGGGSFRQDSAAGAVSQNAVATTSGAAGTGAASTAGGTAGSGGNNGGYSSGGGGGGFIGDGNDSGITDTLPYKGISFRNGGLGGNYNGSSSGGFGGFGGGAGGGVMFTQGNGGGGYSGGGIGNIGGGGGGSFPSGATTIGLNTGDGYITITAV